MVWDSQMPTNESCQLRTIGFLDNFTFNSSFFKQFEGQDRDRKSYYSDSEGITEDDYQLVSRPQHEDRERERDRDLFGPKSLAGQSQVSPHFSEDKNERKWQRLRESCAENGEQWKLFDQEIMDTMRQADVYFYDKKNALLSNADKGKSLRAECERMVKENDKLKHLQSQNVTIHRELTTKLDEDLQSMIAV